MRLGFFTYPWDLYGEGVEEIVSAMAGNYGCTAMALNANYHHARLLRPRAKGPKTIQLPGAAAAFQPRNSFYPDERLRPVPHPELAGSGVLARAREACDRRGLDLGLWTVLLHNSTLGKQNEQLCVTNCFGDRYTYCLCPSQEPVRAYAEGLIRDLCTQFQPDRILLEAVGYLGLRHGVHHELFFVAWDDALELLFSLCFCPACQQRAEAAGIDAEALHRRVAGWAERLLHQERGGLPPAFAAGQVSSLLAQVPDLASYVQVRARSVTDLAARLQAATRQYGVQLDLMPASFHRPVSQAWLEGASLADLGPTSDALLILSYLERAAEVAADLEWAAWSAPGSALVAGLNVAQPALHSVGELVSQAQACRAAGCQGIYYYNYGLLSPTRMDWVAQANARVQVS
jgi:hypothetical protein